VPREPSPPTDWWTRFGKVLPKGVRERVYEPALADLRLERFESEAGTESVPFGLSALMTLLGCLPIALHWSVTRPGTLSRRSRIVLVSAVVVVSLVVIAQYFTTVEAGY